MRDIFNCILAYVEMISEIRLFNNNRRVFEFLLSDLTKEEYFWREAENKWNLLEIVCHLYDEEREDFRARLKSVLDNPQTPFGSIDPAGWVKDRKYMEQEYENMLNNFLKEREQSVEWLVALKNPNWDNTYIHPSIGPMSAKFIISNWVAHDYLHIRQITRIKYNYLKFTSGEELNYAGDW